MHADKKMRAPRARLIVHLKVLSPHLIRHSLAAELIAGCREPVATIWLKIKPLSTIM